MSASSALNGTDSHLVASWGLWLSWVIACAVGWAAGGAVTALGSYRDVIMAGYVGVAVGAIATGVLQWLVLRQVAVSGWWVAASVIAAVVVGLVVFGVGTINDDVGWVGGAGLFGTVVGVLQWLVLRGQFHEAGWWVLASTVAWVLAGPAVGFLSWLVGAPAAGMGGWFLGWPALGVVYGAVTGTAMVWLVRQ